MLKLSPNNSAFQEETFSDGKRTAVKGRKEVADQQMPKWKEASIRKLSRKSFRHRNKSVDMPLN
jgi:hypothetical protein